MFHHKDDHDIMLKVNIVPTCNLPMSSINPCNMSICPVVHRSRTEAKF